MNGREGGKREGTMSGNAHFLGTRAVPSARPSLFWLLLAHVLHILAPRPALHAISPLTTSLNTSLTPPLSFSLSSPLFSPSSAPSPLAALCQIFVAPQARPHSVPASDFAFASLCYFFRILFAVFFFFSCLPAFPLPALHTCMSLAAVGGPPLSPRLSRPKYLHLPALFVPMKWKYVNKRRKLAPAIKHTQTHTPIHTHVHTPIHTAMQARPGQAQCSCTLHIRPLGSC